MCSTDRRPHLPRLHPSGSGQNPEHPRFLSPSLLHRSQQESCQPCLQKCSGLSWAASNPPFQTPLLPTSHPAHVPDLCFARTQFVLSYFMPLYSGSLCLLPPLSLPDELLSFCKTQSSALSFEKVPPRTPSICTVRVPTAFHACATEHRMDHGRPLALAVLKAWQVRLCEIGR